MTFAKGAAQEAESAGREGVVTIKAENSARIGMADRVGFEPTVELPLRRFSRPLP